MSGVATFLYGANVHANGIRQHYLRYGGSQAARRARRRRDDTGHHQPRRHLGLCRRALRSQLRHLRARRARPRPERSYRRARLQPGRAGGRRARLSPRRLACSATPWWAIRWARASRSARRARHACGLTRLVAVDPPVSGPAGAPIRPSCPGTSTRSARAREGISLDEMRTFCPTWTEEQLRLRAQWLHTCDERAIVTSFEDFPPTTSTPTWPHVPCRCC
jgi:N-formylmaleamate deformylase